MVSLGEHVRGHIWDFHSCSYTYLQEQVLAVILSEVITYSVDSLFFLQNAQSSLNTVLCAVTGQTCLVLAKSVCFQIRP